MSKHPTGSRLSGLMAGAALGAAALALSACGSGNTAAASTNPGGSSTPSQAAPAAVNVAMTLQVDADSGPAGWYTGKEHWPRLAPGDGTTIPAGYQGAVKLPAHTKVTLVISSHDDGVTKLPKNSPYNTVAGGEETVDGQPITEVANANIAHTITVPELGINIPVPASPDGGTVTVKFTFTTGDAGTYLWRCMTPCGAGTKGMSGSMAEMGWMRGNFVVA